MRRDRQEFEKDVLANGITVYTYRLEAPIVSLEIQLPVGAAHSHEKNGFLPGAVHFLEHLQLIRSYRFPEAHQLNRELGLRGGHFNGSTYRSKTRYSIDVPVSELDFAVDALIDRVYHPIFNPEDVERERTVVINERKKEKFYPGRNRASQYYNTSFMSDMPYPIEQLYGSNENLEAMSAAKLEEMHKIITQSQATIAIAVGDSDFSDLKEKLAQIPTIPGLLEKKMNDTHWADPSFRYVSFDTVSRPTLEVAWIHPRANHRERTAIDFIISLLLNNVHGTLYQELRHKRGWVYNLQGFVTSHKQTLMGMTFPTNTVKQLEFIREHIHDRIDQAIQDQEVVEQEIRRRLNNQVYFYQTASSIMSQASSYLIGSKKIFTEREFEQTISDMAELALRKDIVERFFAPGAMGSIGFLPN